MSEFIAINPINNDEGVIKNSDFFPDIDLNKIRLAQNLDGTVTPPRLKSCALAAIARVNLDLNEFAKNKQAAGFSTLASVPASQIDQQSILVQFYLQAVYCHIQALLIEKYINFDATAAAHKNAETVDFSAAHFYRESRYAVRDILGISRSTFALV